METLSCTIYTHFVSHKHTNFHSPIKSIKSQPTLIVSAIGINEGVHRTRIPRKPQHQHEVTTIMEPRRSPEKVLKNPSSKLSLLEKIFNALEKGIIKFLDPPLDKPVDPIHVVNDNFSPVDELSPTECGIHGFIPPCVDGAYIRIGPNAQFPPSGPHHYLDGDGMVHSIRISRGRATFCSRYVKTNKYISENKVRYNIVPNVIGGLQGLGPFLARVALFVARGISGHYDIGKGFGVANTNLSFFSGRLYALCESDLPYEIEVKDDGDIVTIGHQDFNGQLISMNMTAHPKIDPVTNEAFAFRYWVTHPFLTYFRFDSNGNKQPDVPIFSMKTHSLTHDMGITQKYAIIFDIQLGANPMNLIRGEQLISVDQTKVPRIGVLPRYAKDESDMKWFEVPGLNILHAVNAWDEVDEDGGDVVAPIISSVEHFLKRLDMFQACMEKVTIHMGTGVVSRRVMSNDNLEFPVINPAYLGKKNKYTYAAVLEKALIKTTGVVKLDNEDQHEQKVAGRMCEKNCFSGEPFFIARDPEDPNSEEDDGYLVSYMHDENSGESSFVVMDAKSPTLDVVGEVKLPQRVPYGLHGIFIREKDIKGNQKV